MSSQAENLPLVEDLEATSLHVNQISLLVSSYKTAEEHGIHNAVWTTLRADLQSLERMQQQFLRLLRVLNHLARDRNIEGDKRKLLRDYKEKYDKRLLCLSNYISSCLQTATQPLPASQPNQSADSTEDDFHTIRNNAEIAFDLLFESAFIAFHQVSSSFHRVAHPISHVLLRQFASAPFRLLETPLSSQVWLEKISKDKNALLEHKDLISKKAATWVDGCLNGKQPDLQDIVACQDILLHMASRPLSQSHKKLASIRQMRSELSTRIQTTHKGSDGVFRVFFAGIVSSGKSSCINALIGFPHLLPADSGAVTTLPCRVRAKHDADAPVLYLKSAIFREIQQDLRSVSETSKNSHGWITMRATEELNDYYQDLMAAGSPYLFQDSVEGLSNCHEALRNVNRLARLSILIGTKPIDYLEFDIWPYLEVRFKGFKSVGDLNLEFVDLPGTEDRLIEKHQTSVDTLLSVATYYGHTIIPVAAPVAIGRARDSMFKLIKGHPARVGLVKRAILTHSEWTDPKSINELRSVFWDLPPGTNNGESKAERDAREFEAAALLNTRILPCDNSLAQCCLWWWDHLDKNGGEPNRAILTSIWKKNNAEDVEPEDIVEALTQRALFCPPDPDGEDDEEISDSFWETWDCQKEVTAVWDLTFKLCLSGVENSVIPDTLVTNARENLRAVHRKIRALFDRYSDILAESRSEIQLKQITSVETLVKDYTSDSASITNAQKRHRDSLDRCKKNFDHQISQLLDNAIERYQVERRKKSLNLAMEAIQTPLLEKVNLAKNEMILNVRSLCDELASTCGKIVSVAVGRDFNIGLHFMNDIQRSIDINTKNVDEMAKDYILRKVLKSTTEEENRSSYGIGSSLLDYFFKSGKSFSSYIKPPGNHPRSNGSHMQVILETELPKLCLLFSSSFELDIVSSQSGLITDKSTPGDIREILEKSIQSLSTQLFKSVDETFEHVWEMSMDACKAAAQESLTAQFDARQLTTKPGEIAAVTLAYMNTAAILAGLERIRKHFQYFLDEQHIKDSTQDTAYWSRFLSS